MLLRFITICRKCDILEIGHVTVGHASLVEEGGELVDEVVMTLEERLHFRLQVLDIRRRQVLPRGERVEHAQQQTGQLAEVDLEFSEEAARAHVLLVDHEAAALLGLLREEEHGELGEEVLSTSEQLTQFVVQLKHTVHVSTYNSNILSRRGFN